MNTFFNEVNFAVTISDGKGNIIYMNNKSAKTFEMQGGKGIIGRNLKEFHAPLSNEKIAQLMAQSETNCYTIEKNGIKKLIYQTPWYEEERIKGLIEISLEIPFDIPHFVRS